MASKLRPQQKRSRFSDFGSEFSPEYVNQIQDLQDDPAASQRCRNFAHDLLALTSLRSGHQESQALPGLCSHLAAEEQAAAERSLDLWAGLLFQRNSKRIHKQLLDCSRRLRPSQQSCFYKCVRRKIGERLEAEFSQVACRDHASSILDVLLSLMEHPQGSQNLQDCAEQIVVYLAASASRLSKPTSQSPGSAEEAQDTVSCLYLLLHRHGALLATPGKQRAEAAVMQIGEAMLAMLQGNVLLRDGLKSAAVTLWSAARLPSQTNASQALTLAEFLLPEHLVERLLARRETDGREGSFLGRRLQARGTSLVTELRKLPVLPRSCALNGILSILPLEALQAPVALELPAESSATAAAETLLDPSADESGSEQHGERGPNEPSAAASSQSSWDVLVDGAIPTACEMIETAADDHTKQHALSALTVALQQALARLQKALELSFSRPDSSSGQGDKCELAAASETASIRSSVALVEGPLRSQVMAALQGNWEVASLQGVRQIQAAFEAFLDILKAQMDGCQQLGLSELHAEDTRSYIQAAAVRLLALGKHRKGTFTPLKAIVSRLGATWLLQLQPGLLASSLRAMDDDGACQAATAFLDEVLKSLLAELRAKGCRGRPAREEWLGHWVGPVLEALVRGSERLRGNVSIHFLPCALRLDSTGLSDLLRAAVAPLKGRELSCADDGNVAAVVAVLKAARRLGLVDDICLVHVPAHETIEIPLQVLERAIRHSSEAIRTDAMQYICVHPKITLFPGVLELRLAAEAMTLGLRSSSTNMRNRWSGFLTRLTQRVVASWRAGLSKSRAAVDESIQAGVGRQEEFLRWLFGFLQAGLYPGAPFGRKYFAAETLAQLVQLNSNEGEWTPARGQRKDSQQGSALGTVTTVGDNHTCYLEFAPDFVLALLEAAVDSWERTREAIESVLTKLPAPLPGFQSAAELRSLVVWMSGLISSPRVPEADAGARMLRMAFQKYAVLLRFELPWAATDGPDAASQAATSRTTSLAGACLSFLRALTVKLQAAVELAETDLEASVRNSFAHGILLALRFIIESAPWVSITDEVRATEGFGFRDWVHGLLALVKRVVLVTLPILALHEDTYIGAEEVLAGECGERDESDSDDNVLGKQLTVSACWLSLKEASLGVGALARHLPLSEDGGGELVDVRELEAVGCLFVDALAQMKHNGAVEKCVNGLIALTERLLKEPAGLHVPGLWIRKLLQIVSRPDQHLSDINRRSAGIPFAFTAIFLAEPQGGHRRLLREGLEELLDLAEGNPNKQPYPQVHAFNVMRLIFKDKTLGLDLSALVARGLQLSLCGLSSPHWEVRNAASLCYSALVVRALGFKNVGRVVAITSQEFFLRFPRLHPFLLGELKAAAQSAKQHPQAVHPSLFPILALMSRMRQPAWQTDESALDPAAFKALIAEFVGAPQLAVRTAAAAALTRVLTPAEAQAELSIMLKELAAGSPLAHYNQVHGHLLQSKALLEAISEDGNLSTQSRRLADLMPLLALAKATDCPTIAAECIEIGRTALSLLDAAQPSSSSSRPSQTDSEPAQRSKGFSDLLASACASVLQQLSPDHDRLSEASKAAERIKQQAMRPVLVESCVAGLLEARTGFRPPDPEDRDRHQNGEMAVEHEELSSDFREGSAEVLRASEVYLLLEHPVREVRAASLKTLLAMITNGSLRPPRWLWKPLQPLAESRSDHQIAHLAHCIRAALPGQDFENSAGDSVRSQRTEDREEAGSEGRLQSSAEGVNSRADWDGLVQLLAAARSPDRREDVLQSMGLTAKRAVQQPPKSHQCEVLVAFLRAVQAAAQPAELPSARFAAQRALQCSGLLEKLPRWFADGDLRRRSSLDAWKQMLQLTEDEDGDVRRSAGRILGRAVADIAGRDVSFATVDFVQRRSFWALSTACGQDSAFVQLLLDWIYRPSSKGSSLHAPSKGRRLFHKEKDNQHEEPLLFAQLAALQLHHILRSPELPQPIAALTAAWADATLQDLLAYLGQISQTPNIGAAQLAGPTHDPEGFHQLYSGLLGILAALQAGGTLALARDERFSSALLQLLVMEKRDSVHFLLVRVLTALRKALRAASASPELFVQNLGLLHGYDDSSRSELLGSS